MCGSVFTELNECFVLFLFFQFDLLPKSGMASLVCVITRRIIRDNTVWLTNIVTPAKRKISHKKRRTRR